MKDIEKLAHKISDNSDIRQYQMSMKDYIDFIDSNDLYSPKTTYQCASSKFFADILYRDLKNGSSMPSIVIGKFENQYFLVDGNWRTRVVKRIVDENDITGLLPVNICLYTVDSFYKLIYLVIKYNVCQTDTSLFDRFKLFKRYICDYIKHNDSLSSLEDDDIFQKFLIFLKKTPVYNPYTLSSLDYVYWMEPFSAYTSDINIMTLFSKYMNMTYMLIELLKDKGVDKVLCSDNVVRSLLAAESDFLFHKADADDFDLKFYSDKLENELNDFISNVSKNDKEYIENDIFDIISMKKVMKHCRKDDSRMRLMFNVFFYYFKKNEGKIDWDY